MNPRFHNKIDIPAGKRVLKGELLIPQQSKAIIIFSHGSGSSRFSKRNQAVSKYLNKKNFGTLLFDLLTEEEDQQYHNRFDIPLLAKRLALTTEWLEKHPAAKDCRFGYFGASTGAASALKAASVLLSIDAIVCQPDLVMDELKFVQAPTLLIVGSHDYEVLEWNKEAYLQLRCKKKLEIVQGASHLFEEPGALEQVCELAAAWFEKSFHPKKINHE